MRISDWSSDVCSSVLFRIGHRLRRKGPVLDRLALRNDVVAMRRIVMIVRSHLTQPLWFARPAPRPCQFWDRARNSQSSDCGCRALRGPGAVGLRSEEHTSELQSLMRISYAVFCLNKKKQKNTI